MKLTMSRGLLQKSLLLSFGAAAFEMRMADLAEGGPGRGGAERRERADCGWVRHCSGEDVTVGRAWLDGGTGRVPVLSWLLRLDTKARYECASCVAQSGVLRLRTARIAMAV